MIEQTDRIDLKSTKRSLRRPAQYTLISYRDRFITLFRIELEPELGGDHCLPNLLTEKSKGFAHEFFVGERAVNFGVVKERIAF